MNKVGAVKQALVAGSMFGLLTIVISKGGMRGRLGQGTARTRDLGGIGRTGTGSRAIGIGGMNPAGSRLMSCPTRAPSPVATPPTTSTSVHQRLTLPTTPMMVPPPSPTPPPGSWCSMRSGQRIGEGSGRDGWRGRREKGAGRRIACAWRLLPSGIETRGYTCIVTLIRLSISLSQRKGMIAFPSGARMRTPQPRAPSAAL